MKFLYSVTVWNEEPPIDASFMDVLVIAADDDDAIKKALIKAKEMQYGHWVLYMVGHDGSIPAVSKIDEVDGHKIIVK